MIEVPIQQILFLDIETVGITSTYNDLQEKYPMLHKQFHNYFIMKIISILKLYFLHFCFSCGLERRIALYNCK